MIRRGSYLVACGKKTLWCCMLQVAWDGIYGAQCGVHTFAKFGGTLVSATELRAKFLSLLLVLLLSTANMDGGLRCYGWHNSQAISFLWLIPIRRIALEWMPMPNTHRRMVIHVVPSLDANAFTFDTTLLHICLPWLKCKGMHPKVVACICVAPSTANRTGIMHISVIYIHTSPPWVDTRNSQTITLRGTPVGVLEWRTLERIWHYMDRNTDEARFWFLIIIASRVEEVGTSVRSSQKGISLSWRLFQKSKTKDHFWFQ